MRTVHEPELPKASATNANPIDPTTGQPKKGPKLRLTANGGKSSPSDLSATATRPEKNPANAGLQPGDPEWDPSPPNDNIQYVPAHHPITGQPGYMITYPPDIVLTAYEGNIRADELMSHIRRQLHWAQQESEELKADIEELEDIRREEWIKKEILLEATMSGELAHGYKNGLLSDMGKHDKLMVEDVDSIKGLKWTRDPWWKEGDEWAFPNAKPMTKRETSTEREEEERLFEKFDDQQMEPETEAWGQSIMRCWDGDGVPKGESTLIALSRRETERQAQEEAEKRRTSSRAEAVAESVEEAQKQQAEADTMAVEALMGLSGAAGGSR